MLSPFRNITGFVRATLDTRPTSREFERLGLTADVLEARAAEIDAATPEFAQTRGKTWAEIGSASAAFLALLRELPDGAGADAVIAHLRRSGSTRR